MVEEYTQLRTLGDREPKKAGDAIEQMIARIFNGDKADRYKAISVVTTPAAEIVITDCGIGNRGSQFYYSDEIFTEPLPQDTVRRNLEIPASVIAMIGADLGFTKCRYAV